MDTIIFFILINLLFSADIMVFIVYFWIFLISGIGSAILNVFGMSDDDFMLSLMVYAGWFLSIFIKIFFLIYMNKICKKNSLLGKFFDKLKCSLRFRMIVLCIAAFIDLSVFLFYFPTFDFFFLVGLIIYLLFGTGVVLSYISLYIWFDIQKIISFIKKRMCKQG